MEDEWKLWWVETDKAMTAVEARSQDEAKEIVESKGPEWRGSVRLVCDFYDHRRLRVHY